MASHTPHPDTHTHGLADDCPRCEEHAAHPWTLDDENILALWRRMLAVEYDSTAGSYRSKTEAKAGLWLYHVSLFLERMGINPRTVIA